MVSRVRTVAGALARRKGLANDSRAQVSFSVIAVVLLVASAATGAYMAKRELDRAEEAKRLELLDVMKHEAEEVAHELGIFGAARARDIVSGWSEFPVNSSRVSDTYSDEVNSYIQGSYPRQKDGFTVEVRNWTGGLFFVEKRTLDLVPSNETSVEQLEIENETMDYESLPAPSAETLSETTSNPYYVAVGNFTVLVSCEDVQISEAMSYLKPVVSALPFLETKLRAFESASSGEFSDLGRLVSYMLTTLAQLRVLEGYGVPMYSAGRNTTDVVTELDVYRAVSVGLLLEQARLFRAVDTSFASDVSTMCGGDGTGLVALMGSGGRYLDPAELFLWFLGKKRIDVDPAMLVSQAVCGLADQLVVKLMDYLGWLGLLDIADLVTDIVTDTVDSVIAYFTGEDKAQTAVAEWVRSSLEASRMPLAVCQELFRLPDDLNVFVPERTYFVENAAGDLYPVWVGNASVWADLPTYDLLGSDGLAEFYPTFKEEQGTMRQLVTDSVTRLGFDIASSAQITVPGAYVDPSDDEGLFDALSDSAGEVELTLDPSVIAQAASELPMFSSQYALSQSFAEFLAGMPPGLFPEGLMESAYSDLSETLLETARYSFIPDLAVPVADQLREIVRADVESDDEWGVSAGLTSSFVVACSGNLDSLSQAMLASINRTDDEFMGPLVDSVAILLSVGSDCFPGMREAAETALTGFAKGVLAQKRMGSYKPSVYVDLENPFEFWDGDLEAAESSGEVLEESLSVDVVGGLAPMQVVPYDPATGYESLHNLFPTDNLLVQVQRPWDFDRSAMEYPNAHMTSVFNFTETPYSTQWTVSVVGLVELAVSSESSDLEAALSMDVPTSAERIKVEVCVPVVVHSAWPLLGVEYNPTNTLISDSIAAAKYFASLVWKKIEPVVGWMKDGLERVFSFAQRAFEVLASFATRVVKLVSDALQVVVELAQKYLQKFADKVLGKVVQLFVDVTGRVELRISLYGFVIIIQTDVPDLLFREAKDLLRLMVYTDRFGPGITFGIRIAKLADGRYDIVANGTLAFDDVTIEVAVDPLMHVLRKLVEFHAKGDSWGIDLVIPEVQPYETAEVSTADLPGVGAFLSNVPLPALGASASIEAGLRLKYSPPFPTDVVVNEFEPNPAGEDDGREWVELYNPLDEPRCIDGWMLSTVHGESNVITLKGSVPSNGLSVFMFAETAIDNGYPNDPFNDGDALVLMDPLGKVIDITPTLADWSNDGRTHQRSWDGGPRWVFQDGSKEGSNGPPLALASADFIAKALFEAFKEAFLETQLSEVSASLDFLAMFGKRVLNHFIENLLAIVSEVIHEVIFYFEVVLSDATGSAGFGFRASFVVTGEAIVDLLRWLIHSLATFVVNLGRASNPIAYPAFPGSFLEGLYVRFEVLFQVGVPRAVRAVSSSPDLDGKFTCAVAISPNVPALGRLAGRDWGKWRVEFGVYLEGVPRELVADFLSKDVGDKVDLWVVKACAYGR